MPRSLALLREKYAGLMTRHRRDELRAHALGDRFFLLTCILGRQDAFRQWLLERCDEVQVAPDGYLDLWARFHYKSTIITFAGVIQEILRDREITVCIFSHNRPSAKAFLKQIKQELENNKLLQELFDDVLWAEPHREAQQWSENDGLKVKRKSNPKESTIEAWGLVDGQPIGKHYKLRVYDDLVTLDNVGSAEMRAKVLLAWENSLALTTEGGRAWHVGTKYHYADAYDEMGRRGTVKPRVHQAELGGVPVLLSRDQLEELRRDMGPYTFAAQMMLDPKSGDSIGFRDEWLRTWLGAIAPGNRYIIGDPANSKRKGSDFTSMWVVEACADQNLYVRDMVRDRLNLAERIDTLIRLVKLWQPKLVGWEEYGLMADVQAIEAAQAAQGYRFRVVPLGGKLAKDERIVRLVPRFARGGIWLPERLLKACRYSAKDEDLVKVFLDEEYRGWPYVAHDDMLDALSRIEDPELGVLWPREQGFGGRHAHPSAAGSSAQLY
jgi:phage terminase large subunit-like protein